MNIRFQGKYIVGLCSFNSSQEKEFESQFNYFEWLILAYPSLLNVLSSIILVTLHLYYVYF